MTGLITQADVDRALIEAMQTKGPDHVDTTGQYVDADGRLGCLIGVALNILGIPGYELASYSDSAYDTITSLHDEVNLLAFDSVDTFDYARTLYQNAQDHQDSRKTWGHAVTLARQAVTFPAQESSYGD